MNVYLLFLCYSRRRKNPCKGLEGSLHEEDQARGEKERHLPVRTQHIIDRLKFLETYHRVGRPTQSTLVRLEESSIQPMPTQGKGKKAKSTSSESSGSDENGSGSGSEVKRHLIYSLSY